MAKERNHFKVVISDRDCPSCKKPFEKRLRIKESKKDQYYAYWYYCKCGQLYMPEEAKRWKYVNAEEEPKQLLLGKSNSMSAHAVEGNGTRRRMKKHIVDGEQIPCLIQPPIGTILYNGNNPPWD